MNGGEYERLLVKAQEWLVADIERISDGSPFNYYRAWIFAMGLDSRCREGTDTGSGG